MKGSLSKEKKCETEAQRHAKRAKERIIKKEKQRTLMSKDKLDMLKK